MKRLMLIPLLLACCLPAFVLPADAASARIAGHFAAGAVQPQHLQTGPQSFGKSKPTGGFGVHAQGDGSVFVARETSAPKGCYLRLGRLANYVCCGDVNHRVCTPMPSKLPGR